MLCRSCSVSLMTEAPLTVIDDPLVTVNRDVTLDEILEEKNEDNQSGIPNTLPEMDKNNDQNKDILPEIEDNFESRSEKVSTPPEITEKQPEPSQNLPVESQPDRLVIEPEVPADPGEYTFELTH